MSLPVLTTVAVAAGYLIGSIPFGYLTALGVRGIDIRTVGSGNIGATNVGRVLGFRFFVFVFLLDLLKGFVPTLVFPKLVAHAVGHSVPQLGVFVALATILGHNFPIYLRLHGGKGVATSLGALFALDWVASLSAAVGFTFSLVLTGYVSLSSLFGGVVFLAAYFLRVANPWNGDHLAMSVVTIGLVGLLVVRHRKNLARIRAGTEPKVSLRRKPPAGRVAWVFLPLLVLVAVGVVYGLTTRAAQRAELRVGPLELVEVARAGTGHQRTDRVTYADGGRLLAVTCPRYNRVVLYAVDASERLELVRDIELKGRPVAVAAAHDRIHVLERPSGDRRHVEPGWCEAFDFRGEPVGTRFPAGMYPDDLALTPDGAHALLLTSGRGEGDPDRPAPALEVLELGSNPPRAVGRVEFNRPGDDPCRITLSDSGQCASVTLLGTEEVAAIDLGERTHPRILGRSELSRSDAPHLSVTHGDSIVMAVTPERDAVMIPWPEAGDGSPRCLAGILPGTSGLTLYETSKGRVLGRLPLRAGALNLSIARPMAIAFTPERGLLAVATRSGSVHVIAVRQLAQPLPSRPELAVAGTDRARR